MDGKRRNNSWRGTVCAAQCNRAFNWRIGRVAWCLNTMRPIPIIDEALLLQQYDVTNIEAIVRQVLENFENYTYTDTKGTIQKEARAAYLVEKQNIQVKTYPIPEINEDEVLVKVEGCGVCGTDVHEYKNDPFGLIPAVLGHEGTGHIVKLGKNVKQAVF